MYPPYNVNWKGEDTEAADSDEELRYWQIKHKTMRSNEHNMLQGTFLLKIGEEKKIIQSKNNTHEEDGATAKYENSESHEKIYYNFFLTEKSDLHHKS